MEDLKHFILDKNMPTYNYQEYLEALHEEVEEEARAEGLAAGLEEGRAEGLAQGHAEGLEQGIEQGRQEIISKMKAKGLSDKEIKELIS